MKPLVVFVCTGNCIRSQMAEGLLRALARDRFEVASAGVSPAGFVHELAIEVMDEMGIDISEQESKGLAQALAGKEPTAPLLIVLCEWAAECLESLPRAVRVLHWHIDDPFYNEGSQVERLAAFRRARDDLEKRLVDALAGGTLETPGGPPV
jgi:arsenate reductase